jgi:integrase
MLDFYEPFDPVPPPLNPRDVGVTPMPWAQFTASVMELYKPSIRSKHTARGMRDALDYMPPLGVRDTSHLTIGLIARWVESCSPELSANTVRARLRAIRVYCNLAVKQGWLKISPFDVRPMAAWVRPGPRRSKKHHSRAEIKHVLDEMARQAREFTGWDGWHAKRLYFLTSLLAHTGLRAGEAYHLHVEDLDLDHAFLSVVSRAENRLKTYASAAVIPLAPPMIPIAREWLKHRMSVPPGFPHDPECVWLVPTADRRHPWTSGYPGSKPRDRMAIVGRQCGIDGFNPLSLRHSFATHLMGAGCGPSQLRRILRHSNNDTQEYYLHDDLDDLRDAVSGIEF